MRRQLLIQSALAIAKLGFHVFLDRNIANTWGYFSDGNNVGYFQQCEWANGIELATVNKVPGSDGMHFLVEQHGKSIPVSQLTAEYLRKAFRIYPEYFTEEDKSAMRSIKYLSLQDFLSSQGENLQELKKIIDHGSINS